MKEFYTSKLTLEIEVSTQFGPDDAVQIIASLTKKNYVPAIKSVKLTNLTTDYIPRAKEDINRRVMSRFPIVIR
jgi:hypothetical protein